MLQHAHTAFTVVGVSNNTHLQFIPVPQLTLSPHNGTMCPLSHHHLLNTPDFSHSSRFWRWQWTSGGAHRHFAPHHSEQYHSWNWHVKFLETTIAEGAKLNNHAPCSCLKLFLIWFNCYIWMHIKQKITSLFSLTLQFSGIWSTAWCSAEPKGWLMLIFCLFTACMCPDQVHRQVTLLTSRTWSY